MDLKSAVAIITGGGRGIGRATAIQLAREQCNVVVASRSAEELHSVVEQVESCGSQALGLALDLSREKDIEELVRGTIDRFGYIDILINNAGVLNPRPLLEIPVEEWDRTMELNLRGVFILSQMVLRHMKDRRRGYIVNISSTVALGVPKRLASYGASKCGLAGLSEALYQTGKEFNVKVSCVYPGITDTRMVRNARPSEDAADWMRPEDIAYCIMFLLKQSDRMIVKDLVPWAVKHDQI